ncbi:MAG: TIGR00303 family protein [Symploca sp. SIO2B6]|nr:TIGR00303 family protein [Symploca sp. SIO2B6]
MTEQSNCHYSCRATLSREMVQHLFQTGLAWGKRLACEQDRHYLVIGECVVGGTTTALATLSGLGYDAKDKVNSSHPTCNHQQKWQVVSQGLQHLDSAHPVDIIAAVGDPMQPVVAGMAIAASRACGVLLAGGTQMLAVYGLIKAWTKQESLDWNPNQIVVGTTRWVADDPTGDTVGLAKTLDAPLLATQLHFHDARYPQLQAYEQGFVKEGVAAGGCAIAAALYQNWTQEQLLAAIEGLIDDYQQCLGMRFDEQ